MQRAQKFRVIGLAGVALLAVAVPLGAAMAGPAGTSAPAAGSADAVKAENRSPGENGRSGDNGAKPGKKAAAGSREPAGSSGRPRPAYLSGRTSRCGPELTAPQGVGAQTCVLAEGGATWGRTYYRNRTGDRLRAVLTLLRPDGRTVQVTCEVPAGGVPGLCETPSAPTARRSRPPYAAVAEIADAAGERLLLRSGSNSPVGGGGSGR
ncbi:hypothetical protein AB0G60_08265 [Streptomyces angustmyceticus]|uniref:Uncharacterized protein n=1 Tax=Streptomyces angustmyceticus TaxID=285578 RepID=A0A5J4LGQ4_9ACTN|nr:hypothetical protein [Streptomyces angustmyceticus]UAL68039.1 hypothetical protein K7396_17220 [Streptomyces angustmyceticus]GES30789.1 hypothetical protein San01_32760 [Streptomyces angustmyceticus]